MAVRRVSSMLFGLLLLIACMYSANAQITSCPLITINDLGSTTELSTDGLIAQAIFPPSEAGNSRVPVRIRDFTIVCDASGTRINTSSYVSVVVELECNFQSTNPSLAECDGSTIDIRQYQFQCIAEEDGQPFWGNTVDVNNLFVQTEDPTATLSTPLANQCRRCIDDRQSMRPGLDPITHCDPCPSECRRCYIGRDGNECCNFYLQGNCVNNCSSALVNDSNFNCVCPELTLVNGTVSYSDEASSVVRNIDSVATHTCDTGFRLLEGPDTVAQQKTRTCSTGGWSDPGFTCERIICPDLSIMNGVVGTSPPGRVYMSRTIYTCDDGYALKGDDHRVCQIDSMWNGTDPECADCSAALQDPNCVECGFDSNGLPICAVCKVPYKRGLDGKCEKEVETSASSSSCDTGCIIGIVLAILGAIILSIVVVLVVYAVYRYLSNPATKLAKAGTEGLNGVARDNPLYLPPEDVIGDVETA